MNVSKRKALFSRLLGLTKRACLLYSLTLTWSLLAPSVAIADQYSIAESFNAPSSMLLAQSTLKRRSMSEAISIAKRRHPGKVISAKFKKQGRDNGFYRIKILTRSGDVRTLEIPAYVARSRS